MTESLSDEPSRTIEDMLQRLLTVLGQKLEAFQDDGDTDEDGFMDYDEGSDDGLGVQTMGREKIDYGLLQKYVLAWHCPVLAGSPSNESLQ